VPTGAVLQVANALDPKQRLSDQPEGAEQLSAISRAAETAWLAAPVNLLRIFRRRYAPSRNRTKFWGPIHRLRRDGGAPHRRLGGVRHWAMPHSSQGGKGCQAVAVRPFTMDDDDRPDCCSTCDWGSLPASWSRGS
jgi:hypothetical protein